MIIPLGTDSALTLKTMLIIVEAVYRNSVWVDRQFQSLQTKDCSEE